MSIGKDNQNTRAGRNAGLNIAYAGSNQLPARSANAVHVMKICSALANAPAVADASAPGGTPAPARRNNITLITPRFGGEKAAADNIYEYYGVPECFEIQRIAVGKAVPRFLKGLAYARGAIKHIKSKDIDIVYGRNAVICALAALKLHKPVGLECHSLVKKQSLSGHMFRRLIKSKHLVRLVVISDALKEMYIRQYGLDEEKILTAHDGADAVPEDLPPAGLVKASEGMFHVGYIGHLYRGRGMELLGDMAKACPFAFFHIVGGYERDAEHWKEKYKDIPNIHFYGYVPHPQTAGYGKSMDALIAPYQYSVSTVKWMSPLKVFEYMALGKPVVCSDIPVLREVLTDEVNALLCPPEDAAAWSEAIKRLHEDKTLAESIAARAQSEFLGKYTWQARARNILEAMTRAT